MLPIQVELFPSTPPFLGVKGFKYSLQAIYNQATNQASPLSCHWTYIYCMHNSDQSYSAYGPTFLNFLTHIFIYCGGVSKSWEEAKKNFPLFSRTNVKIVFGCVRYENFRKQSQRFCVLGVQFPEGTTVEPSSEPPVTRTPGKENPWLSTLDPILLTIIVMSSLGVLLGAVCAGLLLYCTCSYGGLTSRSSTTLENYNFELYDGIKHKVKFNQQRCCSEAWGLPCWRLSDMQNSALSRETGPISRYACHHLAACWSRASC